MGTTRGVDKMSRDMRRRARALAADIMKEYKEERFWKYIFSVFPPDMPAMGILLHGKNTYNKFNTSLLTPPVKKIPVLMRGLVTTKRG